MNSNADQILAWSNEPAPDGIQYNASMLQSPADVEALFIYCKHEQGVILADGWRFLFDHFGLNALLFIDEKSQWLTHEDRGERICKFVDLALMSGYNPVINEVGDYDPETGMFLLLDGTKTLVDWKAIYQLKENLE